MGQTTNPERRLDLLMTLLARHAKVLLFVLKVILPAIVRDRRRPVIFARYIGMGDIICTVPAARELMKRHPGATFIYNCHPDFTAVPGLAGVADRVTSLKYIGLVGYWYRFLLGGFYDFAHGDDMPEGGCQEPMITEFCRQFDVAVTEKHPALPITSSGKGRALAVLAGKNLSPEGLILIHPGPSWPVREWPHERWVQLVKELRERGFHNIGQLGVGRYMNFGKVEVPVIPGAVSLLDAFTIEECIAIIAQATLFIGIDSGLLHIAACTRTPAVGIFGMTLPEYRFSTEFRKDFVVTRVECAGCEHRKPRLHWVTGCPYDVKCMSTLAVDAVLPACLGKLPVNPQQFETLPLHNEPHAR